MTVIVKAVNFVGQKVQAHNFRTGPHWVAGVTVERLGPLTYLVQVDSEIFKLVSSC